MKAPAAAPLDRRQSVFAGADVCQVAGLRLRAGTRRPNYNDAVWDLTELADVPRQSQRGSRIWDFSSIMNLRWRYVAKDLALALLAPRHPDVICLPAAFRTPRNPATVFLNIRGWVLWFNWLSGRGIKSLADVTSEHCDAYLTEYSWSRPREGAPSRRLEPNTVKNVVKPVQVIALYGPLLQRDRYAPDFLPWEGRPASVVAGYQSSGENTTPLVPDEVLRPLLANALYHVDVIGPHVADLLSAVRNDPLQWTKTLPYVKPEGGELLSSLGNLMNQYTVSGKPLPALDHRYIQERVTRGWDPADPLLEVHIGRLFRELGYRVPLRTGVPTRVRTVVEQALAANGSAGIWGREAALVDHAVTGEKTCWTVPLTVTEVHQVASYTLGAALIVTAALTGMRHSELLEISVGSCRVTEISPGRLRYFIASRLIKGQPLGGIDDEWVTVEEVYRAIGLAERLTQAQPHEPLFGGVALNQLINNFRRWCREPFAHRLGLAPIPEGPVNGRMLRRTLAVEIATRPNGLLAAKIHLKHLSVATTEGYVARPGGSQSAFRGEIEDEEHRHHLQLTADAFQQYLAGAMPSGPGARELIAAFKHVDEELQSTTGRPTVLGNERRLENLLRQRAATLHVGVANFCWFTDPAKALCLRLAGTPNADQPIIGMCDSARCPQATHHEQHRPVWDEAASTVKAFLGNPRIPKPERARLQVEYERTLRIVEAIDQAATPREASPR